MADSVGQQDILQINYDKMAKGFADESLVLKKYVTIKPTNKTQMVWYQKTSGFLTGVTTTGITASPIANIAKRSSFSVAGPTWTKNTSYVRKYGVESEMISMEDVRESDLDVLKTTMRDLSRAVGFQVDTRIYNVLSESLSPSNINTTAAVADGWDDAITGNPLLDILIGNRKIAVNSYDISNVILYINPVEYQNLVNYIVNIKGESMPALAESIVRNGVLSEVLNNKIIVSNNATTDYALQFVPKVSATWRPFTERTAKMIEEPGIGVKIRVWEEGEAILTDPKAVHLITDTVV